MLGTKRKLREMSLKMFTSKALKPIYSPLAVMKKETYERRNGMSTGRKKAAQKTG